MIEQFVLISRRQHAPDPLAAVVVELVVEEVAVMSMMAGITALCVTEFPDPLSLLSQLASPVTGLASGDSDAVRRAERAVNCERGCLNTS